MILLGFVWGLGGAFAQEPVSYDDALSASLTGHPSVRVAEARREGAVGSVKASSGAFDPLYRLEGDYTRSDDQGFFQGFPFTSDIRSWGLRQSVSGSTGTGTEYSVSLGVDRNISEFQTDFGLTQEIQLQDAYQSDFSLSITQQLLRGIRFRYNVQDVTRAKLALTTADLELERERQDAMYAAAEAYWNWAYLYELHTISEEGVAVAEEAFRVGTLRVGSGQLAPVEGTRLEAALVQARQDALDASNLAEQSANALLIGMGRSPGEAIVPVTEPGDAPAMELDSARVVQVALEQNLDLAIARHSLDTAFTDHKNAKHGTLPSLALTGSAGVGSQRCPVGTDNPDCVIGGASDAVTGLFEKDNQPFVAIGAVFEVPLGNRGAQGAKDQMQAVVWERERVLAEQEQLVLARVEEQLLTLRSASQRIELADTQVRLADETLRAEEALSEAGRTLLKDVLEARTDLQRARAEAAKARTDARLAQAFLLKLQGQLSR